MPLPSSSKARAVLLSQFVGYSGQTALDESLGTCVEEDSSTASDESADDVIEVEGKGSSGSSQPETLLSTDTVYLKLQSIEDRFLDFAQAPFDISKLEFKQNLLDNASTINPGSANPFTVLDLLHGASPATKQLAYRINGFQSLLVELGLMQRPLSSHEAKHEDLTAIISIELDKLLQSVDEEKRTRSNLQATLNGLRQIHPPPSFGRFMSPMMIAVIILIAIVHCMMGVARDHCHFLLKSLRCILRLAAQLDASRSDAYIARNIDSIPITLHTALHYLDLEDKLDFYVACPSCNKLFKEDAAVNIPDVCTGTNVDGIVCGEPLFRLRHRGNHTWRKPRRRFSHQRLESWLSRFLNRPGIEDLLEATRPSLKSPCTDFWDAPFFFNFPGGVNEPRFFDPPADELRLAFLVYHDFFNPFGNKIAGKKRSIGLVMMVCLNLPPDIRYDLKNIYVTAMIPGPKEPALEHINNFIHPIAQDLLEHYDPGVYVAKTAKYPRGRKVRSAAPITSMDIPASRAFGGIGGQQHTIFCSFCAATLPNIDNFNLSSFPLRTMDQHRLHVARWLSARSSADRQSVWIDHAARHSEWLCFPWWDVFTGITIAPLHWVKNVLEKQIRENMGCSTTIPNGIPEEPALSRPISNLEIEWGKVAMKYSSAQELEKSDLPEPLLRFLCRERQIFEAGLSSKRLIQELNHWRVNNFLTHQDGSTVAPADPGIVSAAKIEYYLEKASRKEGNSLLNNNATMPGLRTLCTKFSIPWDSSDRKASLINKLVEYYANNLKPTTVPPGNKGRPKHAVSILGMETVAEIHDDLKRTTIPTWLKTPPLNFATVDHGKLASEELKSLALVSLPITLIRLWGASDSSYRPYLDHFLHLSAAIRILSYQSLTTHDIALFEFHYNQYLGSLKLLYPYCSVVPVQHLGLHLPHFLRSLGPSARYSENTSEMFIGILEDVSTNSRFGELEQTLHRELNIASNLKVMMEQHSFPDVLGPFKDIISEFLQNRYPTSDHMSSKSWNATHDDKPMTLDILTHDALCDWTSKHSIPELTRNLFICSKIRRGNVIYQPYNESSGNSCVCFRPRGLNIPIPGRIDAILREPNEAVARGSIARTVLVVRAFEPLSAEDKKHDPYAHHPIVGQPRLGIMSLFYNSVDQEKAHIIEPDDIVSHVAIATFHDASNAISAPCIVVIDLDLKHTFSS